jgi:hypothetical protein
MTIWPQKGGCFARYRTDRQYTLLVHSTDDEENRSASMAITKINNAVCELLDRCCWSDDPRACLHEFVDKMVADPSWSRKDLREVLTRSHGILKRSVIRQETAGHSMHADPKTLLTEFLQAYPNATKQDAAEFADQKFPDSPLTIAMFLADWVDFRERLIFAVDGDSAAQPSPAYNSPNTDDQVR